MATESQKKDSLLKTLIEFAEEADLQQIEWEKNGQKISFKRNVAGSTRNDVASSQEENGEAAAKEESGPLFQFITSPMVGTFWRAAKTAGPPLIVEGDNIKAGQKVATVEAMKVSKDVVSDITGKVKKILIPNGKPVEYGQKIIEVEINA